MFFRSVGNFKQWREAARKLLAQGVAPDMVSWSDGIAQPHLFGEQEPEQTTIDSASSAAGHRPASTPKRVPRDFLKLAETVACNRDSAKWPLLYRTLWRLTTDQPHVLQLHSDDDVLALNRMSKEVTRDAHKMKAFVRFRRIEGSVPEAFVAWHRPDHLIVRYVAPFFARRFKGMYWTIITPDESVVWDQNELAYGPGAPRSAAPEGDCLEELWKTYYASTFNPARIKIAAMKREMPVRHWKTMPETELIDPLLAEAGVRVDSMLQGREGFDETATAYLPERRELGDLQNAASECRACDLCESATQTVFGEGPAAAHIAIIGEQPGDSEDLAGRPFCGPAGQLLDEALQAVGLERSQIYVTNVVKHFKFVQRGKRRLHVQPSSREIYACRPWLEEELKVVQPTVAVCLGATASQALMGRDFRISHSRGQFRRTDWCDKTLATWHPSAILRMTDPVRREEMFDQLTEDLRVAIDEAAAGESRRSEKG